MTPAQKLSLNEIETALSGLSKAWLTWLGEASCYCFHLKNHKSGVEMKVEGNFPEVFQVCWNYEITEKTKRSWNDTQELTEYGATGVALLLTHKLTEFNVIERAPKDGGGFDYWLGYKDAEIFERSARLEISGILEATKTNTVKGRVEIKKKHVT